MKTLKVIAFLLLIFQFAGAQVKIGNNPNTIDPNSLMELETTNKGLLPPRVALVNQFSVTPLTSPVPAGMIVRSSGGSLADGLYMWSGTKWELFGLDVKRSNYVLVKSAADLPAPVGGIITLVAGTLYEINGTITLSDKINLNGCYVAGADAQNDKIIYTGSGELFTGSGLGAVRYLTLTAASGKIFNINGGAANSNLRIQNCYIVGCSEVGTIDNVGGTVYFEAVAYFGNSNGITFQNCTNVLLHNTLWDNTNANTFEKFNGAFNIIQILGGDRLPLSVNSATALSISGITSLIGGSVKVVMFVGTGTFVAGTFDNAWEVEATGLKTEKDDVAAGNIYLTLAQIPATTTITSANTPVKLVAATTAGYLFRVTTPGSINNRLEYSGSKQRVFEVICSLACTQPNNGNDNTLEFYIAKNGVILPESRQQVLMSNNTDHTPCTLSCAATLNPNDYVEVWVINRSSGTDIDVESFNLSIR